MWRRKVLTAIVVLMTIIAGGTGTMFLLSLTSSPPANLGVRQGRLVKCPESPNCVSTQAEDQEHWIAPMTVSQKSKDSIETLEAIVLQMPRTQIVLKADDYLRAEFRSALFRFVDDVEFYAEAASGRIHFRSASRVGRSDLGVNRARMEKIRNLFAAAQPEARPQPKAAGQPSELQAVP